MEEDFFNGVNGDNNKTRFFNLLEKSNLLKQRSLSLFKEDPESFYIFLHFLNVIEENLNYVNGEEYIQLAKRFVTGQIDEEDFSIDYLILYSEVLEKVEILCSEESLELTTFLEPDVKPFLFSRVHDACITFQGNLYSEELEVNKEEWLEASKEELKFSVQKLLVKLQKK